MERASVEKLIAEDAQVRTPRSGVPLLLQKLSDKDLEFHELVETLRVFPSIAGRLLSVANSAWSTPTVPITTVQSACMRLGLRLVCSISISLVVSAPFNVMRCPIFDAVRYWHGSLLVADVAEYLAVRCTHLEGVEPRAVYTAGLLHNLGLLWLADKLPDELRRACELAARDETPSVNRALQELTGVDIGQVGGLLLRSWGLPDILAMAVTYHRTPEYVDYGWQWAALVGGAADIVSSLRRGANCPAAASSLDRLEIAPSERDRIFADMRETSDKVGELARALGS